MARVVVRDVNVRYQLMSVREHNLKRRVAEIVSRSRVSVLRVYLPRPLRGDMKAGGRLGLVGANGAGKSTLLAVLAGLLPPTSGSVGVEGRVLALLGGAGAGLDQESTGVNNVVSMGVQLGELPATMRARVDDVIEFSGLGIRAEHPVYTYSSGMQARLRFSILTSLRPDVLLLDEGIGTADAAFAQKANERLHTFMSGAGILVLASHGDELLRQQCDAGIWLDRGIVRAQGPIDFVLAAYHASYVEQSPVEAEAQAR